MSHLSKSVRGLIETPIGSIHYCMMGGSAVLAAKAERLASASVSAKPPILAFHMSPRSVDEFVDHSLPSDQLMVAFDEPGYGYSDNPNRSCTIDEIADNILYCADHLDIREFFVTGSLMGCYYALSLASRYPERVKGLVLTNLYLWPDKIRKEVAKVGELRRQGSQIIDPWEIKDDGSHIMNLWQQRASWLSAELNTRVVRDEIVSLMKRKDRYKNNVHMQEAPNYDLENAIKGVEAPVLCIQGVGATTFFDDNGYNMTKQFDEALRMFHNPPKVIRIDHPGSINLLNQNAYQWSRAVESFLAEINGEESESSEESE
jgi:pimeloyl-ACP methyl ester carboxylesterase